MKKNKIKYLKHVLAVLSFILISLWPKSIGQSEKSLISIQYDEIVERYRLVKKGEQSELKNLLIDIIDDRLKCYSNTADYSLRLQTCRKYYGYEILRTARENLKSSPSVGDFMLCIQDCPLAYSFCNGEDLSENDETQYCKEIEALCIERCLDAFWRGNSLSETK